MSEQRCKCGHLKSWHRMDTFSCDGKTCGCVAFDPAPEAAPTECLCDEYGKDLCAIHNVDPEAAPASEAKAPAVLDDPIDHRRNCPAWTNAEGYEVNGEDCACGKRWRIDIQTLHELKAAWEKRAYESEAEVASLREKLARDEARVAILDAQEVKLPELDKTKRAWGVLVPTGMMDHLKQRELQLLDAQRAVQAKNELLRIASEEVQERRNLNGLPPLDHIGRWEHKLQLAYDALAGKGE